MLMTEPTISPSGTPKRPKKGNIWYILFGLAVLVVFAALIIVSVLKRNPMKTALLPDPEISSLDRSGSTEVNQGIASVDHVDVMILESFPVQINALVRGNLADGCVALDDTSVRRENNTFYVDFLTSRTGDMCIQALVPFEKTVSIPVSGLMAGTYTISVVGTTATFTLNQDNVPAYEAGK